MSSQSPKVDPGAKLIFVLSAAALLGAVYVLVSSLVNTYNKNSTKGVITTSSKVEKAAKNLKPVGVSSTSDAPAAVASTSSRSGKEIYVATCKACHAAGVAGSPKLDDKAAWEPRVATGLDALLNTAIKGKGAMPARGGNPAITDDDLKTTILYMTKEAGFDLAGGAAPAATAPVTEEKPAAAVAPEADPVVQPKAEEVKTEEPAPVTPPKVEETKAAVAEPKVSEEKIAEPVTAPTAPDAQPEPPQPETPRQPDAPATETPPTAAVSTPPPGSKASLETGKKVYDSICFACHKTGVAGSPILGDKETWAPRIATGPDALYSAVIKGKGAMPPKGGNMSISDDDIKAAVDYIVSESN